LAGKIECTSTNPNDNCPNCGGQLTKAQYYYANLHSRRVRGTYHRAKAYDEYSYPDAGLQTGGICLKCARAKNFKALKNVGIALAIAAVFAAIDILLLSFGSNGGLFAFILTVSLISFTVALSLFISFLPKYLKLRKKDEALTENDLSFSFANNREQLNGSERYFSLGKHKYLQKTHKSGRPIFY
jgi:hypothetical protein